CPTHNTDDASCHTVIDYVDGDLTLNGNGTGYGILVVRGTLTMDGNFTWYGLVLVVGDGVMRFNGGGNGKIVGMLVDAKIWDSYTTKKKLSSVGSPTFLWNGGGVNSVQYDHCWTTSTRLRLSSSNTASIAAIRSVSSWRIFLSGYSCC